MEPRSWPEPVPEVARAVRAKYSGRQVPLPVAVRDRLGELFADAEFAEAFAVTGPRGWSPGRLALVTVLQMAGNLTGRQAAEAVRDKLSWSYALGLGLGDPGFDFSVLSQLRTRVAAHGLEGKVLDLLVARLVDQGLLAVGGKQRTDSTHVVAAVRDLNRLLSTPSTTRSSNVTGSPMSTISTPATPPPKATCPAGHTSATWNPVVSEGVPKTVGHLRRPRLHPLPLQTPVHHREEEPASTLPPSPADDRGTPACPNPAEDQGLEPTTPSGPASRAPSGRPPLSPAHAGHATAAWRRPVLNTSALPSHST